VVCAFIALDRVLSPQYLIWLAPLVVALPRARGMLASALLGACMVLTQLWFPGHYFQLLAFDPLQSWLVVSRDILLLALLGTLVWPLSPAPGAEPGAVRQSADAAADSPVQGRAWVRF
jgi:hypothetical protein